ncbi:MAG TPA: glycine cleavage T C-terminal barrel domain-containing protein [Chthoniobacterales bacterium]|nr:glycine cleavage T C-terminal barrel domain-containing protein [Chthoniobacterales bacterium]
MLIDLSDRAKLRVTGPDRTRFLNGQLTNDIANLQPGISAYACALSAKGKLCGDLFITPLPDALLLDYEPSLRDSIPPRLEKYLIADQVELEDVTEQLALFHVVGVTLPDANIPEATITTSNRFAVDGKDLLLPATLKNVVPKLVNAAALTDSELERFRIEQGIPRWGPELSEGVIPNEAGLDERAISYTKGCYLGQEIISRIKSLGHVNRHLRGVCLIKGSDLEPGDKLVTEDSRQIGTVTSAGISECFGGWIGLAYLRRGFDQPGTVYSVSRSATSSLIGNVEVRSLPFVQT